MIHFTSDLHFFHANILRYCSRPFASVQEMNEHLILNWNRCVQQGDDIYMLGDFAFCNDKNLFKLLRRLNGNIHIILGNHDKVITKNQNKLLETGLIKSIQTYKELKYEGKLIVLFHYACRVWNGSHKNSYHLFAHSHNTLAPYGRSFDVGVDSTVITTEYRPISIKEVIRYMEKIPVPKLD